MKSLILDADDLLRDPKSTIKDLWGPCGNGPKTDAINMKMSLKCFNKISNEAIQCDPENLVI